MVTYCLRIVGIAAALLVSNTTVLASEIRVAVASNFAKTADVLVREFERTTDYRVTLLIGSTGKHYAQIMNGLSVDVFLAADAARPEMIERAGLGLAGSRFTYAIGQLVLWHPNRDTVNASSLLEFDGTHLAIANPKLAPYGVAAQQTMRALGVYGSLKSKLVRGENVAQTYQFVKTGNAQMGFVARAQLEAQAKGFWLVPADLYQPIAQQAILLSARPSARVFTEFLQSEKALELIRLDGYDTP